MSKIVVWTSTFEDWLKASLTRLPSPIVLMYDSRTGKKAMLVDVVRELSSVDTKLVGNLCLYFEYCNEDEVETKMKRRMKDIRMEVWALLCGLRGDDDTISRESLELKTMRVLECTRNQAEDIVQRILVARCLSAGRSPFMADAPPHEDDTPDDGEYAEYAEDAEDIAYLSVYSCPDDMEIATAHQELVDALLSVTDVIDPVDEKYEKYLQGTRASAETDDPELAAADIHARRPEFLAQAHMDEATVCCEAQNLKDMCAYVPEEEIPDWVVEHESKIRPAQFAKLAAEIGQAFKTDFTFDDRALGLLYDTSMHFLDGLFDASAAQCMKRRKITDEPDEPEDVLEDDKALLMREIKEDDEAWDALNALKKNGVATAKEVKEVKEEPDMMQLQDLQAVIPEEIRRCMRGRRTMRKRAY